MADEINLTETDDLDDADAAAIGDALDELESDDGALDAASDDKPAESDSDTSEEGSDEASGPDIDWNLRFRTQVAEEASTEEASAEEVSAEESSLE